MLSFHTPGPRFYFLQANCPATAKHGHLKTNGVSMGPHSSVLGGTTATSAELNRHWGSYRHWRCPSGNTKHFRRDFTISVELLQNLRNGFITALCKITGCASACFAQVLHYCNSNECPKVTPNFHQCQWGHRWAQDLLSAQHNANDVLVTLIGLRHRCTHMGLTLVSIG